MFTKLFVVLFLVALQAYGYEEIIATPANEKRAYAAHHRPSHYRGHGPSHYHGHGPAHYQGHGPSHYQGHGPSHYQGHGPSHYQGHGPSHYGNGPSHYGKGPTHYGNGPTHYGGNGPTHYGGGGGGSECTTFLTQVKLGSRRLGYLALSTSSNTVARDKSAASVFHFDRHDSLKVGRSSVGSGNLKGGSSAIKLVGGSDGGITSNGSQLKYGKASFCYLKSVNKVFAHTRPISGCQAVTLVEQCTTATGPTGPNPSDTIRKRSADNTTPLEQTNAQRSRRWEAARINASS